MSDWGIEQEKQAAAYKEGRAAIEELAELKARVAMCLSEIEWDGEKPCPDGKSCPWCCATGSMLVGVDTEWQYKHNPDCELAALLKECGG